MHGEKLERMKNICGKEWWGKRPLSHTSIHPRSKVMKFYKRLLHKIERRQGKEIINYEI